MSVVKTQGTTVQITDVSPNVTIGEVISFTGPNGETTLLDKTSLDDSVRSFTTGLRNEGQITLNCHYDPTDTAGQTALRTDMTGGTSVAMKINFADPSPDVAFTFTAVVINDQFSADIDALVNRTFTLQLSGALTIA